VQLESDLAKIGRGESLDDWCCHVHRKVLSGAEFAWSMPQHVTVGELVAVLVAAAYGATRHCAQEASRLG
jgi:hypothetical protein